MYIHINVVDGRQSESMNKLWQDENQSFAFKAVVLLKGRHMHEFALLHTLT
jgi:hypothetical protein